MRWRSLFRFVCLHCHARGYSSVVEHPAAVRQVLGSTPSVPWILNFAKLQPQSYPQSREPESRWLSKKQLIGPNRDLNPGPPAPKAGIIPLDHLAAVNIHRLPCLMLVTIELPLQAKYLIWQRWDSNPRPRKDWCLKPAPQTARPRYLTCSLLACLTFYFFSSYFHTQHLIYATFSLLECLRPYHVESTSSRPITEVKQHWAKLVLGWVTAWEYLVSQTNTFFITFFSSYFHIMHLIYATLSFGKCLRPYHVESTSS